MFCRMLQVEFVVKVFDGGQLPATSLILKDSDNVIGRMFGILQQELSNAFVEVRYRNQILSFTSKCKFTNIFL